MRGSSWNRGFDYSGYEVFSKLCIPPEVPFFVRLDGRRFQAISETLNAEKPFDEKFAKCLVASAKALFHRGPSPTLAYAVSDEINLLFLYAAPFKRRVEKTTSILAGVASSAFSLRARKFFEKTTIVAFDARIIVSSQGKIAKYLAWRQRDAWRNHNNAYAYWFLRKTGHKPSEVAERLKGMKTEDLHNLLFRHGVNLTSTPVWQRRGIFIYRELYKKLVENHDVARRRIQENWNLPLFTSKEGKTLIHQIIEWAKPVAEEPEVA